MEQGPTLFWGSIIVNLERLVKVPGHFDGERLKGRDGGGGENDKRMQGGVLVFLTQSIALYSHNRSAAASLPPGLVHFLLAPQHSLHHILPHHVVDTFCLA